MEDNSNNINENLTEEIPVNVDEMNSNNVNSDDKSISFVNIFIISIFLLVGVLYISGYMIFSKDGNKFDFSDTKSEDENTINPTIDVIKYDKDSIKIDENTKYLNLVFNDKYSFEYICRTDSCSSYVTDGIENILIFDGDLYLFNYKNLGLKRIYINEFDVNNFDVVYENGFYVIYIDDESLSCDSLSKDEILNNELWNDVDTFDDKLNSCKSLDLKFTYKYTYKSTQNILDKVIIVEKK